MLGIVVVKLANTPDGVGLVERRHGAWIALGVTRDHGLVGERRSTTRRCAPRERPRRSTRRRRASAVPERSHVFDTPGPEPAEPPQPAA